MSESDRSGKPSPITIVTTFMFSQVIFLSARIIQGRKQIAMLQASFLSPETR
ncbi:hypothetical protein X732_31380 [Mesorhizobium sp. L2C066B000]|nr:hypothetical protein X732_31380 [Mesorhizobium sp. L2C066B000]